MARSKEHALLCMYVIGLTECVGTYLHWPFIAIGNASSQYVLHYKDEEVVVPSL